MADCMAGKLATKVIGLSAMLSCNQKRAPESALLVIVLGLRINGGGQDGVTCVRIEPISAQCDYLKARTLYLSRYWFCRQGAFEVSGYSVRSKHGLYGYRAPN